MSGEPCAFDGVDSVATCRSCGRRVCNRHMILSAEVSSFGGTITVVHPSGTSQMRVQAPTAAIEGAKALAEETHAAAATALAADPPVEEIPRPLVAAGPGLDGHLCRRVWRKLAMADEFLVDPPSEVVHLELEKERMASARVRENFRVWAWPVKDRWLDDEGRVWSLPSSAGYLHGKRARGEFLIPCDATPDVSFDRGTSRWHVRNGRQAHGFGFAPESIVFFARELARRHVELQEAR